MIRRIGKRTLQFAERPFLLSHSGAVGKKEGGGPLGAQFDFVTEDDRMGQKSWELAESELQKDVYKRQVDDLILNLAGALIVFVLCRITPIWKQLCRVNPRPQKEA